MEKRTPDHGILMRGFEAVTAFFVRFSLAKKLEDKHPNGLDIYTISWVVAEIVLIVVLVFNTLNSPAKIALSAVLIYHLFEIGVTSFNSVVIMPLERKRHLSVPRLFSVVLVNYIEVILVFTVIFKFLLEADSVMKSLQNSVYLAALNAPVFSQETNTIIAASVFEVIFGILFIAGLIGVLTNYLGNKE
jgi:hypothetical protein